MFLEKVKAGEQVLSPVKASAFEKTQPKPGSVMDMISKGHKVTITGNLLSSNSGSQGSRKVIIYTKNKRRS